MADIQNRIAECFAKHIFEQPVHQFAATPMRHEHMGILRKRNRAIGSEIKVLVHFNFILDLRYTIYAQVQKS